MCKKTLFAVFLVLSLVIVTSTFAGDINQFGLKNEGPNANAEAKVCNTFNPTDVNVNTFNPSFKPSNTNLNFGVNENDVRISNFSNQTLIFERDYLPLPAPFAATGHILPWTDGSKDGWNTGGGKFLVGKWTWALAKKNSSTPSEFEMTILQDKKPTKEIEIVEGEPSGTGWKGKAVAVAWAQGSKSQTPGHLSAYAAKRGMEAGALKAWILYGSNTSSATFNWGFGFSGGGSGGGQSGAGSGSAGAGVGGSETQGKFKNRTLIIFE